MTLSARNSARKPKWLWFSAALVTGAALALATFFALPPETDGQIHVDAAQKLLDHARRTRTVPARFDVLPVPLPEVRHPEARKALFIALMLPLIVQENTRIEEQRARALTALAGTPAYSALAHAYDLPPDVDRARLLRRIDIVPASLALAQGALESGWGTSRFARDGHAYFGVRTYDPDSPGIAPEGASGFKVQSYPNPRLSVRAFFKTLNTHPAYARLRAQRQAARATGRHPTGLELAPYLKSYSEIGSTYVKRIEQTIRANALSAFNGLSLAAE